MAASASSVESALKAARAKPHVGPLISTDPGRTDTLPIDVHDGSYVIPADVVSALGENNTLAGMRRLNKIWGKPAEQGRPSGVLLKKVPIVAAGGEYVLHPDQVMKIGKGDMKRGHEILDEFVKAVRGKHISTLQKLPGPSK